MQNAANIGPVTGFNPAHPSQAPDRAAGNDPSGLAFAKKQGTSPYYQIGEANGGQLAGGMTSQQALNQRVSSTHSPMNALEQYAVSDYNLSSANIAFQQIHGRGLMLSKEQLARQRVNQQRATTSHGSGLGASLMNQSLMTHGFPPGHPQSVHQPNIGQQMRHMHLNYKGGFGKKENINQVIKDCFITKKCGVRKPQAPGQAGFGASGNQAKSLGQNSYQGTYKHSAHSSTKKGRRVKRMKSPANGTDPGNSFYRPAGTLGGSTTSNQPPSHLAQQHLQKQYFGAQMMLQDHQERERASSNLDNLTRLEDDLRHSELHAHNLTQTFAGPNINNMYALEDLDETDPAGLRALRVPPSGQPTSQAQQAFFQRTQ